MSTPVPDILSTLIANIIPENDVLRLAALQKLEILYTPSENAFDKITSMIARVFDTPMAFLSLVDKDTVYYKSQVGTFGKSQVDRKDSFCSLAILSKEPLVITDTSLSGCFNTNPLVQEENGIKFYAGAPLITKDGFHIGALCIVDNKPKQFSNKDIALLTEFANMAMNEIEARHKLFQQVLLHERSTE